MKEYWEMQPIKFEKYINAYVEQKEREAEEIDIANYNLGKYIAYAVNDPKKYPKKPFLHKQKAKKEMTDEEMDKVMRETTIKLGGTIK